MHQVVGWKCAVCGQHADLLAPEPWRCPRSTLTDRHHVLQAITVGGTSPPDAAAGESALDTHPFIRHDRRLAWAAAAAARGVTRAARDALVHELDDAVRAIDGVGFTTTPFARSDDLSDELGFSAAGGVWVKDETGGVGGSQKARHLLSILLHLRASEVLGVIEDRPRLAIASCGNAALAAATLAAAADWPIDVYVPTWMSDGFGERLDALGARVHRCARRDSDPPGDPAMFRFRDAVEAGAIPFTVQGPENALCLDGGRTIGWEIVEQIEAADDIESLDAVFVQVGGGAFAACLGAGLVEMGHLPMLMAVQAAGCAPLDRAWSAGATAADDWSKVMQPWPEPSSLADGILDDETYDWIGVVEAMRNTGGAAVVAPEDVIVGAHRLAREAGFDASPTGTAGLAGLVHWLGSNDAPASVRDLRVAVVMSGVTR